MKPGKSVRPKLPAASEQMKVWSAALADEIAGWPQVSLRAFFGLNALYRKERMFGALPRTRGMRTPNSLMFKLESGSRDVLARLEKDARVGSMQMQKARWFTFEISSDTDLHDALDWLGRAYGAAGKSKSSK